MIRAYLQLQQSNLFRHRNVAATLTGNNEIFKAIPHMAPFRTRKTAPLHCFWQKTDAWSVPGNLVVKGDLKNSNLHQALAGTGRFAGLQMPDPDDANGRFATSAELQMVSAWILNGCPK